MKSIFFYLSLICFGFSFSQEKPSTVSSKMTVDTIAEDSLPMALIVLKEVTVTDKNKSIERNKRIYFLTKKVRKVYPYAKLASERLTILNERLAKMKSKSDKKKYTRLVQRYMEDEFEAKLKKMSRTDGRILVKLIHRQTGQTTFDLVKELRSGWNAFWYNSTAKMFDINLKSEYHPDTNEEDFLIETILQQSFRFRILENKEPAVPINYNVIASKWSSNL
ncbi:MAG: DUF4294 domain-containing protein [Flavobacteriaceae bacterium]|nr:DUF4294 domain-containing protein [Flavobacteriaceae bacterium]